MTNVLDTEKGKKYSRNRYWSFLLGKENVPVSDYYGFNLKKAEEMLVALDWIISNHLNDMEI